MSTPNLTILPTDETTRDIGAPPAHTEWLRADTLRPWRLQRALNKALVRKIARDFDPDALDYLKVSRRDGVDYLLDGQHRWTAITDLLGWADQNVPCLVFEGLTDEQEATLFHAQGPGMRRPLSALHDFYVLTQSGDAEARRIADTVERAGLTISYTGSLADDSLFAIGAVRSVAGYYGIDRLETTLRMLQAALGPKVAAYTGDLIQGFAQFLIRYEDEYDPAVFIAKVRPYGPEGVVREALNMRSALGGSAVTGVGRAFRKIYNQGKRQKALGEWVTNFRPADVAARKAEREAETRAENLKRGRATRANDAPKASAIGRGAA